WLLRQPRASMTASSTAPSTAPRRARSSVDPGQLPGSTRQTWDFLVFHWFEDAFELLVVDRAIEVVHAATHFVLVDGHRQLGPDDGSLGATGAHLGPGKEVVAAKRLTVGQEAELDGYLQASGVDDAMELQENVLARATREQHEHRGQRQEAGSTVERHAHHHSLWHPFTTLSALSL